MNTTDRLEVGKPAILQVGAQEFPIVYLGEEPSQLGNGPRHTFLQKSTRDVVQGCWVFSKKATIRNSGRVVVDSWSSVVTYFHYPRLPSGETDEKYFELLEIWNQAMQPRQEVTA